MYMRTYKALSSLPLCGMNLTKIYLIKQTNRTHAHNTCELRALILLFKINQFSFILMDSYLIHIVYCYCKQSGNTKRTHIDCQVYIFKVLKMLLLNTVLISLSLDTSLNIFSSISLISSQTLEDCYISFVCPTDFEKEIHIQLFEFMDQGLFPDSQCHDIVVNFLILLF